MKRQFHLRALALCIALGCALELSATAGRELRGDTPADTMAGVEPIKAVEPLIQVSAQPKKWSYRASLSASASYNDNIFISASEKEGDFLFTVSPSISVTAGAPDGDYAGHLTLNYAPGFTYYAEHSSENSISQSVLLNTGYRFARLSLGLNLAYHKGKEADAEVGTLVDRRNYSAALSSKYELTDRTSVELNLSKSFSDYDGFMDVSDLVVQGSLNSRFTEALTLGLGVAYGTAEAENSSSQDYIQTTLRATYMQSQQLSFNAFAGGDFRDSGDGAEFSPIFGLSAIYQPFDSTEINLNGSRSILPSALYVQEDKELTSLFLSIRQRFLQRYFLSPSIGYDHTEYSSSTKGGSESRSDDSFVFGVSAATNLTERWSLQLFYQYRRNTSTSERNRFTNQQVGLSSTVNF